MAPKARDAAREARTEVYRQHILDAAERVFAERGFEATKVQDVAGACGLSMGTIYGIFPGKTELYSALLQTRGQELLGAAREVAGRRIGAREALDALIEIYIAYFLEHPDFLRMHLRSGASWALGPALGTETQVGYWQDVHTLQTELFRRGIAEGAFVDEDPSYLAKLFSVMDQVLLAEWVEGGMQADQGALVGRLRAQAERSFARR
jgi:AcrR family transcriptional regulator